MLLESPTCKDLEQYKALYDTHGNIIDHYEGIPLQHAVYYFLRVPVGIGHDGSDSLSPIKPGAGETPAAWNHFKGEESAEYLAFLHRWSADLNRKCDKFFDYLTLALAQPLPEDVLRGVNNYRRSTLQFFVDFVLSIGALGAWMQPLAEGTTVHEFLTQLVELAYYVNKGNTWNKKTNLAQAPMYCFYNGKFAGECIQMFKSFLMTFMSELRLQWIAAAYRGVEQRKQAGSGAAASSFKFPRKPTQAEPKKPSFAEEEEGDGEWASYMAKSRPPSSWPSAGAGAGGPWPPRLALEDEKERKAEPGKPHMARYRPPAPIEDKKKRKAAEPKKPRMAWSEAPRLALEDAPPGVASRKRGRGDDDEASSKGGEVGKASSRHGGRRNRARHSSSRGRRGRSKCSIM